MKIAPVSADLLIKLALAGVAVGVAVWAARRVTGAVSGAVGDAAQWARDAAQWVADGTRYVNPASPDNLIYSGINDRLWPDGSQTLGTWLYNEIHFEEHPEAQFMGPPDPPWWDNRNYTSVTPPVTGSGGAAFGIYPRPGRGNTGGASGSW